MYAFHGWLLRIKLPEGLIGSPAGSVRVSDHIDNHVLNSLKATNRLAKLHPDTAVLQCHFKDSLTTAHLIGAKDRYGFVNSLFQKRPPFILAAKHG